MVVLALLVGLDGFGESADLVDFQQQGIAGFLLDACLDPLLVGDQEVVAYDLHSLAHFGSEGTVALPIVLVEGVLDGYDGVLADISFVERSQFSTGQMGYCG